MNVLINNQFAKSPLPFSGKGLLKSERNGVNRAGIKGVGAVFQRIAAVKEEVRRQGVDCLIQVDGGVSAVNAARLVENGADILVAGSAVFKAADPAEVISAMRI